MDTPLVETVGLTKHFKTPHGLLHAIDKVDLKIGPCRTLAWWVNPAAGNPLWQDGAGPAGPDLRRGYTLRAKA